LSQFPSVSSFEKFADGFLNFERDPKKNIFWLDTMEFFCVHLGNPQSACPTVHVAGSKGKGSVSKMISCILDEAGFSAGLYSSPHLVDFAERICSAGGFFPEEIYAESADEVIRAVKEIPQKNLPGGRSVTWFELATLFAMTCFKNAKTDYAVYEVGLGGRLDATNVIRPCCSCITQIELEHTEFLGDTVEKIAAEKGGIIKEKTPVIISPQSECVKKVFEKIAAERNAPVKFAENEAKIENIVYKNIQSVQPEPHQEFAMEFSVSSRWFSRDLHVLLPLMGKFQAENAVVASLAAKTVLPDLDEKIIERGLSKSVLPGRFENVNLEGSGFGGIKNLILDGAHTVKSTMYTMETFRQLFKGVQNLHLLFGCASDKDVEEIAPFFSGIFSSVILTRPGSKSCDFPRMENAFHHAKIDFSAEEDFRKSVPAALKKASEKNAVLLVSGSFYLAAEVKKFLSSVSSAQRVQTVNR
jgi:dihydrofolate synthase/folylpolyglutamate synthase